jgi:polysaccharide export outer membrane protein
MISDEYWGLPVSVTRLSSAVLCACALLYVSGCASDSPSYDSGGVDDGNVEVQSTEYRIGPGDSLQIFVWDHGDLSTTVQVRPDGKISTPLVEDLQAAGRTSTQLARDIESVLEEYVRTPVVTVIMQGFVGEHSQQIRVVGQAVAPQSLQFRQGMTVLDVLIAVGGLSEFAAGNRSKIIRKSEDSEIEIKVRLADLINKGKIEQNVKMRPGDVLIIPESIF